jgi:hypothetical protein
MRDNYTIKSVLGFNLKLDIRDENGELIRVGAKCTCPRIDFTPIKGTSILDKSFFTHFDEALLAKIRDYRNLND